MEALATRVVILNKGRIINEGDVATIKMQVGLKRMRFSASATPLLPEISRLVHEGTHYDFYTSDADAIVRNLLQQGIDFSGLEIVPVSLEEAFLKIMGEHA